MCTTRENFTSAQKACTHWPSEDFLKAPVLPPHKPHSAAKWSFSQKLTGAPELLDDDSSSHNSQYHGPVDSLTLR